MPTRRLPLILRKTINDRYLAASMKRLLPFLLLLVIAGCHKAYQPTALQYAGYDVRDIAPDSAMLGLIAPYREKVGAAMDDVVAELPMTLIKALPDGTLGNFMADAYLAMAREKFAPSADFAYMNHGGIRLNQVQAGPLRRGTVYEVMPFDNLLVIVPVSGALVQRFLDHIAAEGGGGVAGLTMRIRDKKAVDVRIQGMPLDTARTYMMVNSDYVVQGGGRFEGFRALPAQKTGYLLRDAIQDYCKAFQSQGVALPVSTEKRIIHDQP
jgi:2',3'-cyclic-nucleotide 2'-phosphodiesterase (5'-nucleotidase family)